MAVTKKVKDSKRSKIHVKKGDTVVVISGKNIDKKGKVIMVLPKENRVVVEKVNMIHRHTKPSKALPQGGIIDREAPIHASNVMLYCPECKWGRKHRIEFHGDEKVRVCRKCGYNFPEKSK